MNKFSNNYTVPEKDRTIEVNTRNVKCALDHPVVYYSILQPGGDGASAVKGDDNTVVCHYCGRVYIYQDGDNLI